MGEYSKHDLRLRTALPDFSNLAQLAQALSTLDSRQYNMLWNLNRIVHGVGIAICLTLVVKHVPELQERHVSSERLHVLVHAG